MTKEQEIITFLNEKVFYPILDSKTCSAKIKIGIKIVMGKMNRLSAEEIIKYFWSLTTENADIFSKFLKEEKLMNFQDIIEEFRNRFNESWLGK